MSAPFTIDGVAYNVTVPENGIRRNYAIRDGKAAGWAKSGRKRRDVQGTYFNYEIDIETSQLNYAEYDALFEVLSDPVESHTIVVPYGQTTLTYEAAIYSGGDKLRRIKGTDRLWKGLTIKFEALAPQKVPML